MFKLNDKILVAGKVASGKTTFIKNKIYNDLAKEINRVFVVSFTDEYNDLPNYIRITFDIIKMQKFNNNDLLIIDQFLDYSQNEAIDEFINSLQHDLTIVVSQMCYFKYKYMQTLVLSNIIDSKYYRHNDDDDYIDLTQSFVINCLQDYLKNLDIFTFLIVTHDSFNKYKVIL